MTFRVLRQIPPMPERGYPGMTEARVSGRTVQAFGPAEAAEKALRAYRPSVLPLSSAGRAG
jgi:hypothetical protein